jgi:C4-dicarboxylate-specific signal transduction histidine kinase
VNGVCDSDASKSLRVPIEVDVPASIVAEVARVRLIQAVSNVVLNAVESYHGVASPAPVIVKAELREALIVLTVEDSGCGMSAEAQQDAVTLFATSKLNGTGFGLPLAVAIIESEHGGHLALRSIKDRGTIVTITLPTHRQVERT